MTDGSPPPTDAETVETELRYGSARLREHFLNQAEAHFRRALAIRPDHPKALHHLGVALVKLGRLDDAVEAMRRSVALAPDDILALHDLAIALHQAGHGEEAAEAHARTARLAGKPLAPLSKGGFTTEQGAFGFKLADYDYNATVRYGGQRPPHPQLTAIFDAQRANSVGMLDEMAAYLEDFQAIPRGGNYDTNEPFWLNTWFPPLDAMALQTMLRRHNPARFLEIGSGMSTKFARHSVNRDALRTRLISIDPQPRNTIDQICDEVRRQPLETCPLSLFDQLEPGDILFLDSSHRSFQGSDVTTFFLDILPRVKPGVILHIHDIYLPGDYLSGHLPRMWNEQYLLAAALLFGDAFEVLFPCWHVSSDPELAAYKDGLLRKGPLSGLSLHGASFWMTKTQAQVD